MSRRLLGCGKQWSIKGSPHTYHLPSEWPCARWILNSSPTLVVLNPAWPWWAPFVWSCSCDSWLTPRQKYRWNVSFRFKYGNSPLVQNACISVFPNKVLCCEYSLIPWNFNEFGLKFQLLNILSTMHVLSGSRPQSLTTRLSWIG